MGLSADDLAFMRETQAEHRPTAATLSVQVNQPDGAGGRTRTWGAGEPIQVRIDGTPDEVPEVVSARLEGGSAVKITADLIDLRAGDRITVSATEVYEVISDGDPDRWASAQVVWARRIVFPARV